MGNTCVDVEGIDVGDGGGVPSSSLHQLNSELGGRVSLASQLGLEITFIFLALNQLLCELLCPSEHL